MQPIQTLRLATVTLLLTAGLPLLPIPDSFPAVAQMVSDRKAEGIGDTSQEANRLFEQGEQQLLQGKSKAAIQIFEQILKLEKNNPVALDQIGEAYLSMGQYDRALETLQTALTQARSQNNDRQAARTLTNLGDVHRAKGNYTKAIELTQQAIAIQTHLKDNVGLGKSYLIWGAALVGKGNSDQAIKPLQQGLDALKQATENPKSRVWEGRLLAWMGRAQSLTKQPEQGLQTMQQALAINRATGDRAMEGSTLFFLGLTHVEQEKPESAIAFYQQSLAVFQTTDDHSSAGYLHNYIGIAHYRLKQYPEALTQFQHALRIHQAGDRPKADIAQVWINIGNTYGQKQQSPQAIAAYQEARAIARKISDPIRELDAILGEGTHYVGQAQRLHKAGAYKQAIPTFDTAIPILKEAQTIASKLQKVEEERLAINQMEIAYRGRGFSLSSQQYYGEAIPAFQQGLTFWRQHRDRLDQNTFLKEEQQILSTLAGAYANNGQYAQAVTTYEAGLKVAEQRNEVKDQSQLLGLIAANYNRLGDHSRALVISQQQLTLARTKLKQNPESELSALIRVGQSLGNLGKTDAELDHYQQALTIARALKQDEAALLNNIGSAYLSQGENLKALEPLQQILIIRQRAIQRLQTGEAQSVEQLCSASTASLREDGRRICLERFHNAITSTLNNLGLVYGNLGRYTEALQIYEQALEIARQYKSLEQQNKLLNNIGTVYLSMGNYPRALEHFQKSLKIAIATGARPNQTSTLNNIGQVYLTQGQAAKALGYFQQSLTLAQAMKAADLEATALLNIGYVYSGRGEYDRALAFYQQSLDISRKHNLPSITGLNNIAKVYSSQGRYAEAMAQYQQVLELARKTGDRPTEVILLRNIGGIHHEQANYAEAMALYQQARQLSQSMGSRSSQLSDLLAQGHFYRELGQYPQARAFYRQALTLSRELGERDSEIAATGNIGGIYRKQAQYFQALEWYQRALSLLQATGDVAGGNTILVRIAQTYEKQGKLTESKALLQKALTFNRQIGARPNEAIILSVLGRVYRSQGKVNASQKAFQQALAIAQSLGDRTTEAEALADLGKLVQAQPELAIAFYKQSVNVREEIKSGLKSLARSQQESYAQSVSGTHRSLADLLLAQGRILEAQQVLELLKIQEIREFTREARTATSAGIATTASEAKILKEHGSLIAFGQKVDACKQSRCAQLSQLNDQQQALTQQYNQTVSSFEKEIRRRKSVDDALFDPRTLSSKAKEIVESQPGTVLIYPFVLEDKIWLLWAAKGGIVKSVSVPVSRKQLGETVVQFRRAVQNPSPSERKAIATTGKQLYDWLIKPLEPELKANKIQNLVFSLDRVTRYIPMSALFDGEKFLIETYAVSTVLSAELTDLSDRLPASSQTSILAMGASEFKNDPPLPNVPMELNAIVQQKSQSNSKLNGVFSGSTFLNQAFTFRALRDNLLGRKILHIATHGKFVSGRPEDSYLVLGTGEKLTIPEIKTLQDLSGIHLVVLSACETALGGADQDGVEISGLSSYFLSNGAKAVMASLWSVDDASTSELMSEFYRTLAASTAQKPMTKAEALRQAQLALIREGGNFARPYYWAPFILIGNGL